MGGIYSLYYMNRCIGRDITENELMQLMNKLNLHWEYNEESKDLRFFISAIGFIVIVLFLSSKFCNKFRKISHKSEK